MSNFWLGVLLSPVVFVGMVLFWVVAFDGTAKYQECGYPCKVSEHDQS